MNKVTAEKDPALLLEAARVFNAAGPAYQELAAEVAAAAFDAIPAAKPEVRDAIMGDVAALYLSGRLPGGYEAALHILEPIDEKGFDKDGRLHLLRALARGQKYNALLKREAAAKDEQTWAKLRLGRKDLGEAIKKDLSVAFATNPSLKEENQCFWNAEGATGCVKEEDDLRSIYKEDDEFRKLVEASSQDSADAGSKAESGSTSSEPRPVATEIRTQPPRTDEAPNRE